VFAQLHHSRSGKRPAIFVLGQEIPGHIIFAKTAILEHIIHAASVLALKIRGIVTQATYVATMQLMMPSVFYLLSVAAAAVEAVAALLIFLWM
jgi:uncharacterized protein (DUF983 family)